LGLVGFSFFRNDSHAGHKRDEDKPAGDDRKGQQKGKKRGSWLTFKFPNRDETSSEYSSSSDRASMSGTDEDSISSSSSGSRLSAGLDAEGVPRRGFRLSPRDLVQAATGMASDLRKGGSMSEREREGKRNSMDPREDEDHEKERAKEKHRQKASSQENDDKVPPVSLIGCGRLY
jgi:hypothetical protein